MQRDQQIFELIEEEKTPGSYQVKFDASNLSSGVYFYKLQAVPTGRQVLLLKRRR